MSEEAKPTRRTGPFYLWTPGSIPLIEEGAVDVHAARELAIEKATRDQTEVAVLEYRGAFRVETETRVCVKRV